MGCNPLWLCLGCLNRHFLNMLMEQPKGFVEKVIIFADGPNLSLKQKLPYSVCPKATPTLLALPYTTGVLRTVDWTQSTSAYESNRVRPFHILFDGMWRIERKSLFEPGLKQGSFTGGLAPSHRQEEELCTEGGLSGPQEAKHFDYGVQNMGNGGEQRLLPGA